MTVMSSPFIFGRFLLSWNEKLGNIEDLTSILESLHDSINFKQSSNHHNISFLDIDVYFDNDNNKQTLIVKLLILINI